VTGYVAEEPGFTNTVRVVNTGAVCPAAPTSNCNAVDAPPPGAGVLDGNGGRSRSSDVCRCDLG